MKSRADLPQLTWTPRRVAVNFILDAHSKPYDPTMLPALLTRLDAAVGRQPGYSESERKYAHKQVIFLITLYAVALAPLSEAMDECVQLATFTSAFLGRKQFRCSDLLAKVVAARNTLAIARGAMELVLKTHLRTNVVPTEFQIAVGTTDSVLAASCEELGADSGEEMGLLDQSANLQEAKRQRFAYEFCALGKADGLDLAQAASFIRSKTTAPLSRFKDFIFLLGVLKARWRGDIETMVRNFPSCGSRSEPGPEPAGK